MNNLTLTQDDCKTIGTVEDVDDGVTGIGSDIKVS